MVVKKWIKGDRVVHATKPEWGTGEVLSAEGTSQDGVACQRLTLRFDRAGVKTLSTAFAELKPASQIHMAFASVVDAAARADTPQSADLSPPDESPRFGAVTQNELNELMSKLPETATDPFLGLRKRLQNTLSLFRFGESPALLLDWAAIQTGLKDPLTRFNRHELESYFSRFKLEIEEQLKKLVRDARKQEPALFDEIFASADAAGKRALRKADSFR